MKTARALLPALAASLAPLLVAHGAGAGLEPPVPAEPVRLVPPASGALGAWLVSGPFVPAARAMEAPPQGIDERALAPSLGGTLGDASGKRARWSLASSAEGPLDMKAALDARTSEVIGYAAGRLHAFRAGRHYLLLAVDDGVRVIVDGRAIYTRDEYRPVRDDDDVVPLDLTEGDHELVLKLHQRDGAWAFRARILDATFAPAAGLYLELPGTTKEHASALASKMSWVSFDRAFDASHDPPAYRPSLTVRFPEGAPLGVPLAVTARAENAFEIRAGQVPVTPEGVGELVTALPPLAPVPASIGAVALEATVAGRLVRSTLPSRPLAEAALTRITRALAKAQGASFASGSRESVDYLTARLARLVARGDSDADAQASEARELDALAAAIERGGDPYAGRAGAMRRALRSPIDGLPSELGVYVPTSYGNATGSSGRTYPLVVGLHGMNGFTMGMMRWIFGGDDPKREQWWEDRHVGPLPPLEAFVITPNGHGNTMYREMGEDDVMAAVAWAMKTFPIDPTRVTITGPSMGGIGSAAIPLHYPHVFAAAAPLCGYHSQFVRRDVTGRPIRPWERFIAEERSNAFWAENGEHLPLWIVHGQKDLPVTNSSVLVDRYERLKYSVRHDHPDAGHNVWQGTYADMRGLSWLTTKKLDLHPAHVRFKTTRTRWGKSAWVSIDELEGVTAWGEVDVKATSRTRVTMTTTGVSEVSLAREDPLDAASAVTVSADGQTLDFAEGEPLVMRRESGTWSKGSLAASGSRPRKRGRVTGPLRDVFHEAALFVYASGDEEARANEHVARALSHLRPGIQVAYPVMSDAEFLAQNQPLANERALFLIGRGNKVLGALATLQAATGVPFPITIEANAVRVGNERFTGKELGAAFIHPNPARPDRYVVVLAGADIPGTLRALSLPEILPDFVVWDERLAPSRYQILLGAGAVVAGGMFTKTWTLPTSIGDPLAKTPRAAPSNGYDATPYLP